MINASKLSKRSQVSLIATVATVYLTCPAKANYELPKGVTLPEGVELPDDFKLPDGIVIPEGFEITEDMVEQYIKYMEAEKKKDEDDAPAETGGDLWFKELASTHKNSDLQMNIQRVDSAAADEESGFKDKSTDTLMSKTVILPIIAVILVIIAVWAFMTKCGKRSCCKSEKARNQEVPTRKSVRSERSETQSQNPDLELQAHFSDINSNASVMTGKDKDQKRVVGGRKDNRVGVIEEKSEVSQMSHAVRSSEPGPQIFGVASELSRPSIQSAPSKVAQGSTANRLSLPTVSVPINQIKHERSIRGAESDQASVQRPSLRSIK